MLFRSGPIVFRPPPGLSCAQEHISREDARIEGGPLYRQLAGAKNVVGCLRSIVLLEALLVGKPVAALSPGLYWGQGVMLEESAIGTIENSPVGTGPFAFGSWTVGESIVINRNEAYWGTPALLETVTFRYINDPSALSNVVQWSTPSMPGLPPKADWPTLSRRMLGCLLDEIARGAVVQERGRGDGRVDRRRR